MPDKRKRGCCPCRGPAAGPNHVEVETTILHESAPMHDDDPRDYVQPADETADLEWQAFLVRQEQLEWEELQSNPAYLEWLASEEAYLEEAV